MLFSDSPSLQVILSPLTPLLGPDANLLLVYLCIMQNNEDNVKNHDQNV